MTRWQAAGLHLSISAAIGLAFVALTLWGWYPGPLFAASGAVGLLTILIPVDVVLGPLLTLLVFKSGKPSLKFDLTVIALLQFGALCYGAWVIAEARPAYVVFFGNQLKVVRAIDLAENRPWAAPLLGPEWVAIPSEGALAAELSDVMAGLSGKAPAILDPGQYQPIANHQQAFLEAMLTPAEVMPATSATLITNELNARGIAIDTVKVLPMRVRDQKMTGVFAGDKPELIAILPVALAAR